MKRRIFRFIVAGLLVIGCANVLLAQYDDTGKRGIYYTKKHYTPTAVPLFSSAKDSLPSPILEDNPEYVELYWKAWSLAFNDFKHPTAGSPFVSDYIDEAFSPNIFQWDTIFMIMFARYAHSLFPSIQSLDNFYSRQYENGYICREIQEGNGEDYVFVGREHTVNPPLFAWAEMENYHVTGDRSRFENVLPVLEKYAEWLEKFRKRAKTVHELYWNTGLGSGMDNMPLKGSGWVDMSSQMVLMYRNLAAMCKELNRIDDMTRYDSRAADIAQRINCYMWNEEDGLFYNVDDQGKQLKLKSVASLWPLLAGVADRKQAHRLLEHLKNPNSFWRTIPFPSLAADEKEYKSDGQYWLGSVWAPTNTMIVKGLDMFGVDGEDAAEYREFSVLAAETYLDGLSKVFKKTGTLWENYAPDSYSRGLPSRPDFVGWTGCGPIQLLIEDVIGLRADAAQNRLVWYLHRIDRHGLNRLRFGKVEASLVCDQRRDLNAPATISIRATAPFDLVVVKSSGATESFSLKQGIQTITVK